MRLAKASLFTVCMICAPTIVIGAEVAIGPGGFLLRDGEPIFPIGAYSAPKGKGPKETAAMGFNLFRTGTGPEDLKACEEAGLWTWHAFNLDFSGDNLEQQKTSIREAVDRVRGFSNLLIFESVDEPAWTDESPEKPRNLPGPLTEGYRYLKRLDSHPVYLNHAPRNTIETLRRYNWACDIVCVDVYPVIPPTMKKAYAIIPPTFPGGVTRQTDFPDLSPATVGDYVDKMKKVAFHDQAVFVVLQGFSWEALRDENDRNPELVIYPSYEQLRFMAFQAIVHGVNGLTVWGLSYNDDAENLSDLSEVLNEVRRLTPFVVGRRTGDRPVIRYEERGSGIGKGVETLVTETEEAVTLFAVNAEVDPATARFVVLPPAFEGAKRLEVLGENREVQIVHGGFTDDFEGFGVHIYQYRKN